MSRKALRLVPEGPTFSVLFMFYKGFEGFRGISLTFSDTGASGERFWLVALVPPGDLGPGAGRSPCGGYP